MDWDMKTSSSQWDWDNLMLFPNRVSDIGKKAQWETETSATAGGGSGGSGHAGIDSGSMQNGSVYSSGCGSGSTFGYGSSSKSSVSVDFSAKPDSDHSKVKVESMEPGYVEDRNLGFLELRSQIDHSRTEEPEAGKSSEIRPNGELNIIKHGFSTKEQQESQRSYAGKEIGKMDRNNDAPTVSVSSGLAGESHIGLKLGKRTYFEDTSASGGPIKATTPLAIPASSASVPAKKSRGLNQSMQTPRCQVEGCNTDLSSSKDYHRRHKVCEIHSKSAKVTVNGQEQRFCQQCSRFHVLSEFDDGKRSCRRRLAGHNERRRKPQPDSMALNSARLGSSFYDSNRSGFLMDRSSFMHPRIFSSSVLDGQNDFKLGHCKGTWPRLVKTEDQFIFDGHLQTPPVNRQSYPNALSRQHADRLLLLLQSNKAASGDVLSQGIHSYTQSPANSVTQALTLSSSSGTAVLGGLEMASATESLPGVSDSGRALSLLSSQSWGSRAPGSASLDLATRPGYTLEQFMHDNHSSMTQMPVQGMQHNFGLVADKFLSISSQSSTGLVSNGYATSGVSSVDKAHQGGSLISNIGGIGNFESPMHGFLQGHELRSSQDARSKDVRRTIDLMQRSSQTQNNESQEQSGVMQHGNGQYMEFQLMRSYEPSVFDSQHM